MMARQSEQIAALEDQLANLPAPDLTGLEGRIEDIAAQTGTQISDVADSLSAQISNFDERLTELEKQPNADGQHCRTPRLPLIRKNSTPCALNLWRSRIR